MYEYIVVSIRDNKSPGVQMQKAANEYAQKGWRVVGVTNSNTGLKYNFQDIYLMLERECPSPDMDET